MLDECKGDKFEEVIRVFAMAVLRKEARRKFEGLMHAPICSAETLTQPENLRQEQRERLIPLVLAHTRILHGQLSERRRLNEGFSERKRRVDDQAGRLAEKHKALLAREGQVPVIEPEELMSISHQVRSAWTGSEEWLNTLIEGGTSEMDSLRTEKFLHVPNHPVSSTSDQLCPKSDSKSLLGELNRKVEEHQSRLQKWEIFRASLEKSQKVKRREDLPRKEEPILKFDMHQELQPAVQTKGTTSLSFDRPKSIELIEAMRSELKSLRKPRHLSEHFPDMGSGRVHTSNDHPNIDDRGKIQVSIPPFTCPPDGLSTNRTISIRGTSIVQELSSHDNNPVAIQKPPNSLLAIESDPESSILNSLCSPSDQISTNDLSDHNTHDPYTNTDGPSYSSLSSVSAEFSLPARSGHSNDLANSTTRSANSDIQSLPNMPPSSALKTRPASLLERTRQSMGLPPNPSSPEHSSHNPYHLAIKKQHLPPLKRQHPKPPRPSSQIFPINPFSSTPSENPRQSDQLIHPFSKHHNDPLSRTHILGTATATATASATPTATDEDNHNKNKSRTREPIPPPRHDPALGLSPTSSTPHDNLFSDQADYESVFKSRPRVVVSPPMESPSPSPERRPMKGRDWNEGKTAEEDDNENEEPRRWDSSPTRNLARGR